MNKTWIMLILMALIGQGWSFPIEGAQIQETVEIVFDQNVSLRDLAEDYLGSPNEWKLILFYNGLQDLQDLQPDMRLIIPVGVFHRTQKSLDQAAETSRRANMEGAGVLAKDSIDAAADLQAKASELKNKGELEAAEKAALEALQWAEKALSEAKEKKVQSVSAILAQKEGMVQSRNSQQSVWFNTMINQELIEQERVRTLVASMAGILFVDGSRISLDENSLTVIGEMKENQIKKTFKAEVTVLQGDVLAHLSALGGRKEFTIMAPGVETTIRSQKFRTTRDSQQVTRVANYDGEIDVAAGQGKVTVKKDEGTKIKYGQQPEVPKKLLPPPVMVHPTPNQVFFTPTIRFEWEPQEEVGSYQLEISADREFSSMIQRARLRRSYYEWEAPRKGLYYYRIYAIDKDSFSGPFSDPFDFYVDIDVLPPFLTVQSPTEGEIILSGGIVVQGTVEKNAGLTVNTVSVEYDQTGNFSHLLRLEPGEQTITVMATDPAGNTTRLERKIIYNREDQLITLDMPSDIALNINQVTLKGTLRPHTRVEINEQPVELPQRFSHILTLSEGEHTIVIKAISPQGETQTLPLTITVDLTSPEISVKDVPAFTREAEIPLVGSVSEPATLRLRGEPVPVQDQRFDVIVALQQGENLFDLEAVDLAGNKVMKAIRILLDITPPEITEYLLDPPQAKGGDIITCQVSAQDRGSGLARTGSFMVSVSPGEQKFKGILTLNRGKQIFEGSVFIPPGIQGTVELQELRIQDRLGNETSQF